MTTGTSLLGRLLAEDVLQVSGTCIFETGAEREFTAALAQTFEYTLRQSWATDVHNQCDLNNQRGRCHEWVASLSILWLKALCLL